MENTETSPPATGEHRRRRRSHRKSSKATYQQRRRLKDLGFWVMYGAVGVAIVTVIAILAGQNSN